MNGWASNRAEKCQLLTDCRPAAGMAGPSSMAGQSRAARRVESVGRHAGAHGGANRGTSSSPGGGGGGGGCATAISGQRPAE
eukprot:365376-Chlamydomonas_euryale.AAC.8